MLKLTGYEVRTLPDTTGILAMVAILLLFILFVLVIKRWTRSLSVKADKEQQDLLTKLSFVKVEVFSTEEIEHPNFILKTWLYVWQTEDGTHYLSNLAQHAYDGKSVKVDARNFVITARPVLNIRPIGEVVLYAEKDSLLPNVEFEDQ